jgi:threonyl-tRNA synthetase
MGVRAETDKRAEKTGFKIREAQLQKIPYMLVIGDKEQEDGNVTVRFRDSGESKTMARDEFISMLMDEIKNKK